MSGDPHSPTTAGPTPSDTVRPSEATWSNPAGSSREGLLSAAEGQRPEVLVGAALVGGFVAARVLRWITGGDG